MSNLPVGANDTLTLDPENPWLGLESYTEATRAYFHGRDEEAGELSRRVQHANLTVLFGQSGLGKTSLLRAGVVPRLRTVGFCPVYVRIDYAEGSPTAAEQIKRAVFEVTLAAGHWTRPGAAIQGESLWEFLHHRGDLLRDADGHPLTPLLIFDQFEEIFTLGQADDAGKARAQQFLEDLADLVENRAPAALEARMEQDDKAAEDFDFARADYRVLIALREDYLAHLESLKGTMPSITQNRMRLARMTGTQALTAVVKPGGKLVTQEVAEAIVRFVAGGSELANAEIEPSLLSLVCRELNNIRLSQHRKEISTDLLAGSRDTILSEFYERALADQPAGVRRVVEDELLTESGYRESLAEERVVKALSDAGAAPDTLATLVNRRLLRIEERLDVRRVELTHDVLCGVVVASREQRHAREAQAAAEQQLAEQRAREAATDRQLKRAHLVIGVCIALLVIAAIGASFGFYSMHRANTAEAQATAARSNAETLVGNLMSNFYAELAPTGQTATLGKLAQMAVDYYDRLPASQMTTQSWINRGMALVRLGQSQNANEQWKAGSRTLDEAQQLFQKLRNAGNHSEDVTYGLALALYYHGLAMTESAPAQGGPHPLQHAADLLRPLASAPHAARRVRKTYADALVLLATQQQPRQGVASAAEARKVLAGLGALDLSDVDATTMYANAAANGAVDRLTLGDTAKAQQLAQQAYALAGKVLARSPGNLDALQASANAASVLIEVAQSQHDAATAARYADLMLHAGEEYVRFDPTNQITWDYWITAFMQVAYVQFERGDVSGALATLQQAMTLAHDPRGKPTTVLGYLSNVQMMLAAWQAETGDAAGALRTLQGFTRDQQQQVLPTIGSEYVTQAVLEGERALQARVQLSGQAPGPALTTAAAALDRIKAIAVPAKSEDEISIKYTGLNNALATATAAALRLGHAAQAESLARQWLALVHATPVAVLGVGYGPTVLSVYPLIETPRAETALAGALAGQGKRDAAVKALQPALAAYAKEQQAGAQGTTFRHNYAYALYVKSLTEPTDGPGPKQRQADLAQAAKLIAGASKEAQQLSQFRYLESLIK